MTPPLLVCGLGQRLRGDDAVGLEAVARWAQAHPHLANHPQVRVLILESPGLTLLGPLGEARAALLVDAVRSGAPPGTLHHLTPEQAQAFAAGHASAHGWGLAETLLLAQKVGHPLPKEIHILGIEIQRPDPGETLLSPSVAKALPQVDAAITQWLSARLPPPTSPAQQHGVYRKNQRNRK